MKIEKPILDRKMTPDAELSNAGDDFHILWTIKKSLELLNFDNDGLKSLVIEGVEHKLSNKLDPTGEKFLGVDLTEYYGGTNFNTAHSVVISQLKYSTRRANENFTFSKLYEGKKSKSFDGSIIHRFATIFQQFQSEFGREEVIKKIKIKLISNRNINSLHLKQIQLIQKFLSKNRRYLSFNEVIKNIPEISKDAFSKMRKASKLSVADFTDFIRLLDFEDCGTNSRHGLRLKLIESISKTSIKSKNQFNSLFHMIWDKVMPEGKGNRTITTLDVVNSLSFSAIEDLFPVSQNFERITNLIEREQLGEILQKINDNKKYLPICLNGGAGIGKSTIISQIKDALPTYSQCILFDCYGAGKYQNSEDRRHLYKHAILQLCNDLARSIGTEFLIIKNESDEVYLKEFIKRIKQGVEILRNRNPDAFLVFIIDAADNSVTAADSYGENSFVHGILNMEIPEGCHIIVSTRTYRIDSLKLPTKYHSIKLNPFTINETKEFAKQNFKNITAEEIEEFHNYTKGIPRVQFYSLNLKRQGIKEIINYLKPNGKNVEDLILDKIEQAIVRLGYTHRDKVNEFFSLLIALPRPVPISYLSEMLGVSTSFLEDLAFDIWNGLIYENGNYSFRDEDFENLIYKTYNTDSGKKKEIADFFLAKSDKDDYASINLGRALIVAEYYNEIIDIVLNRKYLVFPSDPIRNREIYMNRTKLALKASLKINDELTYFKLLFIAAQESKTDKALTDLLINYPDLAMRFGDEASLLRLNLKSQERPWSGSFHLKLAGIYSRDPNKKEISIKHLNTANEWLEWIKQNEEKNSISVVDIAFQSEAILRLYGVSEAITTINRWNPSQSRIYAGNYLIENLIAYSTESEIDNWIAYNNFRLDLKVFIECKLFHHNRTSRFDLTKLSREILRILSLRKLKFRILFKQLLIEFCGVLSHYKINREVIVNILNHINIKKSEALPYFSQDFDNKKPVEMDSMLFKNTLLSSIQNLDAEVKDLLPSKFNNIENITDSNERQRAEREKKDLLIFYKLAIPIYQLKADLLTSKLSKDVAIEIFEKLCINISTDYDFDSQFGYWAIDRFVLLATKMLECSLIFEEKEHLIDLIFKTFDAKTDKLKLRYTVLKKIILIKSCKKISLRLLNESNNLIENSNESAGELTENYLRFSILSSKISPALSKYLFEKAIKSVSEIDIEGFAQIRCIYELSKVGLETSNPQLAHDYARFIEYCDIKLDKYEKKHFPYSEGLMGITNIDYSSLFSILCRWHHRNMIELGEELVTILMKPTKNRSLNHTIAAALLPLKTNYNWKHLEELYQILIQKFDEAGNAEVKSRFIASELRNLKLQGDTKYCKVIYEQIKSGKFIDKNIIYELKQYNDFVDSLKENDITNNHKSLPIEQHQIDLQNFDKTSTKAIESAIDKILMMRDTFYNKWIIENFLEDVVKICEMEEYIPFLNALVEVRNELLEFYSFEKIIKLALTEWDFHYEVRKWKEEKFEYILSSKMQHFNFSDTLQAFSINDFATIFSIDTLRLAEIIKRTLPSKLDLLSDESIYNSFELIRDRLSPKQNEELLAWVLNRWASQIPSEIGDGLWNEGFSIVDDSDSNISDFIRFNLGHPIKKIRWRATHAIVRMVSFGNTNILKLLLQRQNEKDCLPFQDNKYIYYWMSAKLYLWTAIDRISKEYPEKLLLFKDIFLKELLNDELPHVLIRHFIQKSCLSLFKHDSSIYTDNEIEIIKNVNVSKLQTLKRERGSKVSRIKTSKSLRNWSFKFDGLDTLPFWYERVGKIFDLSENDVADVADKIITEQWGYVGNPNKDDFIRNQLNRGEYFLTRNHKGSNPEVEDLSIYWQYHAMFCAADYLLKNYPLIKGEFWDDEEEWSYWLESNANSFVGYWLSDLEDPIPLEAQYWKDVKVKLDEKWRDEIDENFFDDSVGLMTENTFMNVRGGIAKYFRDCKETITINSNLVSNDAAEALLRALHTTKNSYDYYFPLEKNNSEDDYDYNFINEGIFNLEGWIGHVGTEFEGLDVQDDLFNHTNKGSIILGKAVTEKFNIRFDNLYKRGFHNNSLVSVYENWNNTYDNTRGRRNYSSHVQSSGSMLKITKKFLLELLKQNNKNLILQCLIERNVQERYYMEEDNRNQVKLYLIKPDGTIKTLRGVNHKIG